MKLNKVPNFRAEKPEYLSQSVSYCLDAPGSEGVVVKKGQSIYLLGGDAKEGWLKFHKNAAFNAIVIERIMTRTPGVYNYRYGIPAGDINSPDIVKVNGDKILEIGKSFSTDKNLSKGEPIQIEIETLNFIFDERKDPVSISISGWAPRFIESEKPIENPIEFNELVKKAKDADILQVKHITRDGSILYESMRPEDIDFMTPGEFTNYVRENIDMENSESILKEIRL
jgi:hypothetical protein